LDIKSRTGLNTARRNLAGCGTQTAALGFGGYGPPANTGATEEYDGTTWTISWKFKYSKKGLGRSRNSNCSFSFWW
jgi:hypothetical protein